METRDSKGKQTRFSGRVLVADDISTNQILMKSLLTKLGLEVTLAGDGCEAVQKALSETFDVIFMDVQMPNMDGYQATQVLRGQGRNTPIIALTAHVGGEDKAKCFIAGCDEYLSKPIDRLRLIEKLAKYLCSTDMTVLTCASQKEQADLNTRGMPTASSVHEEAVAGMCERPVRPVIDWDGLVARGFDEAIVLRVMPICLEDNEERLQKLAVAVGTHRIEDVRSYAHAMKGSFANVGAVELAQVARRLEEQAKQQDLSVAEHLLATMKEGIRELRSLVSQPGWVRLAKEQAERVSATQGN